MPRTARIDFPGAKHHVMNRGARNQNVFLDDIHCSLFLNLLAQTVERYGVRVHGFAIMPNHFHLMVESVEGNLGPAMKHLTSQYCQHLNWKMGWDGQIFRGRYKSKPVFLDEHWIYLLAYLHLNPVRARLVPNPDHALWTSHKAYTGEQRDLDWLTTSDLGEYFDSSGGYRQFISEVMTKSFQAPAGFDDLLFESRQSSKAMIIKKAPLGPRMHVEQALSEVTAVTGLPLTELLATRRGKGGNSARSLAAWWLVHGAGLSNVEAGSVLKMNPTAISKILAKLRDRPGVYHHGRVLKWMKMLKGQ